MGRFPYLGGEALSEKIDVVEFCGCVPLASLSHSHSRELHADLHKLLLIAGGLCHRNKCNVEGK